MPYWATLLTKCNESPFGYNMLQYVIMIYNESWFVLYLMSSPVHVTCKICSKFEASRAASRWRTPRRLVNCTLCWWSAGSSGLYNLSRSCPYHFHIHPINDYQCQRCRLFLHVFTVGSRFAVILILLECVVNWCSNLSQVHLISWFTLRLRMAHDCMFASTCFDHLWPFLAGQECMMCVSVCVRVTLAERLLL